MGQFRPEKISQLLKQHVSKNTQMVIGPLARQDVEQLVQTKPKIRTLSLNETGLTAPNIWQFSLSKKEDAAALQKQIALDGIQQLFVLRQPGSESEHELLLMSLLSQSELQLEMIQKPPFFLKSKQGILLLGNADWLASLHGLGHKRIYTVANAINEQHVPPRGIKFCDVPVLYFANWPDVMQAYQQAPVNMSYQRLIAFGGDAWQITQYYLNNKKIRNIEFQGRTGMIRVSDQGIQRTPSCFQQSAKGLKAL